MLLLDETKLAGVRTPSLITPKISNLISASDSEGTSMYRNREWQTDAERWWQRMWLNKRSEHVGYCKKKTSAGVHLVCLFWNVNAIPRTERRALLPLIPLPLWCPCLFSPAGLFSPLTVIIILILQASESGTGKQEGKGWELRNCCAALQCRAAKGRSETLEKGYLREDSLSFTWWTDWLHVWLTPSRCHVAYTICFSN